MYWQIQAPGMTMDIVEPKSSHSDDTIQQFTSQEEAARFLEVFSITWQNFDQMIAAIQSTGEAASAGSHQEVASQLARLIVTDRLRLRRSNHATDKVSRGPFGMKLGVWMEWNPAQVQKSSSTEPPKAPANDKIEIKVVDDQTGRVVPGILLDLQVPGGFIEPHTTRQSGLVESLGLESGECEVSCDIKDLTLKNSLVFVGVGDDPIEKAPQDSKATGILDTEPGSRYLIALVEKHKVKKGETLKGVAQTAGMGWQALSDFNWGKGAPAEYYFQTTDIIYIPKKWSQKGFMTNQQHTIRVKREFFIEDDLKKRADDYGESLPFTYDPSLKKDDGGFRFVFDGRVLRCSSEHPSFIYVDSGCWVDNADGKGKKCRDFALVCGPHVYLCEFNRSKSAPRSRVDGVHKFFTEMVGQGCGIEVLKYICSNTEAKKLEEDSQLYLFLGDLHLPPLSWLEGPPLFEFLGDPDIFQHAGTDLLTFLAALKYLPDDIKKTLHFIQTGDMFELWLGESYLFKRGVEEPKWVDNDAPNKAIAWAKDVIDRNTPIIESLQKIKEGNFAEVQFLWGNHDDYLKERRVSAQAGLSNRLASFTGLNGEIFCEHGHRCDYHNFDNRDDGNTLINLFAYRVPSGRKYEWLGRMIDPKSIGNPPERRAYLIGATLLNLHQELDVKGPSVSIYIMAHTHNRDMFRVTLSSKVK